MPGSASNSCTVTCIGTAAISNLMRMIINGLRLRLGMKTSEALFLATLSMNLESGGHCQFAKNRRRKLVKQRRCWQHFFTHSPPTIFATWKWMQLRLDLEGTGISLRRRRLYVVVLVLVAASTYTSKRRISPRRERGGSRLLHFEPEKFRVVVEPLRLPCLAARCIFIKYLLYFFLLTCWKRKCFC